MLTKITIDGSRLNTEWRREKAQRVAHEMHTVINSKIFQDKVLKMDKWGETSKYKDAPNIEIYQMIMRGAEVLDPVVDNEIDIYVDDYYSIKRVIGYTYANTKWIYTNTRYVDSYHSKLVGSNFIHEYGHKLGFDHDFRSTARRPYSICYLLNDIYEQCYAILFKQTKSEVRVCYRSWKTLWLKKYCYTKEVWS